MNDVVKQLIGMGPGLAQAVQGHGTEFADFMEGWNRAQREDEERQRLQQQDSRLQQQDSLALQDRERAITRQNEHDQFTREDRARQATVYGQQDALRSLQIPGQLAELGATADDPEGAQALIESAMPRLMQAFGQDTMSYGMPAVEMAQRTITGRQKKQVEAFVEAALKTSFVADNPDADPELVSLPDHIKRVIGKPSAKLSELQSFAQLPVGKPAKRPSDDVSLQGQDLLVGGKLTRVNYNPKTGTYSDQGGNAVVVDPVPPRQPASSGADADEGKELAQQLVDGFLVPSMLSRRGTFNSILAEANRISRRTTGKPYNAARAQTEYAASQRFMSALNGPQQQRFRALAGTVVNTIDEVKALSREMQNIGVPVLNHAKLMVYSQAMGNTPQGQLAAKYIGAVNTLKEEFANLANGGYAPTEAAWHLANQQINGDFGVQQMDAALTEVQRLINYRMQAFEALTPYGVSPTNPAVAGMGAGSTAEPAPNAPAANTSQPRMPAAQKGERRKFGDEVREWDGIQWNRIDITKQPSGRQ